MMPFTLPLMGHLSFGSVSSVGSLPTDFSELRNWWAIEQAPANGAAVNSTWSPVAGNEGLNLVAGSTVVRAGTAYGGGVIGVSTGFKSSGLNWADPHGLTPWTTTDGKLTVFYVTRNAASVGAIMCCMAPLGNPNSGATNFMVAGRNDGEFRTEKNYFSRMTVVPSTPWNARDDEMMVVVVTYSDADIYSTVMFSDGTFYTANQLEATSIANAAGFVFNGFGDPAFPSLWNRPSTDAGVIGRGLSEGERQNLCLGLADLRF